jgi:hypothetical protein
MPDIAVASEPSPRAPEVKQVQAAPGPAVPEVFDGYHVWRQFHSRTKNRPFWHCAETSQTRWERPAEGAVQAADRAPGESGTGEGDLNDGTVDEAANRRAFLQALYEWRNGGKVDEKEGSSSAIEEQKQSRASTQSTSSSKRMPQLATVKSASRAKQAVSLHSASGNGEASVVKDMIQAGADVHARDRLGSTALHYGASKGHVETIDALVRGGADVNARDGDQDTPLHSATKGGHDAAVMRLVQLGADVAMANARGNTALKLAQMFGKQKCVAVLMEAAEDKIERVELERECGAEGEQAQEDDGRVKDSGLAAGVCVGVGEGRGDVDGVAAGGGEGMAGMQVAASLGGHFAELEEAGGCGSECAPARPKGVDMPPRMADKHEMSIGCDQSDFFPPPPENGGLLDSPSVDEDVRGSVHGSVTDSFSSDGEGVALGTLSEGEFDARSLLEALRDKARAEVEAKYSSRPSTAAARSRPTTADASTSQLDEQDEARRGSHGVSAAALAAAVASCAAGEGDEDVGGAEEGEGGGAGVEAPNGQRVVLDEEESLEGDCSHDWDSGEDA